MKALHIYLTFEGNCEQAFEFYKKVLGGEFVMMSRFSEMPPSDEFQIPENLKNQIMHVTLDLGNGLLLMGSDRFTGYGPDLQVGNNFSVSIGVDERSDADRLITELSENGQITMPMEDTFWGSYFGMAVDQFGINWMISYDTSEQS